MKKRPIFRKTMSVFFALCVGLNAVPAAAFAAGETGSAPVSSMTEDVGTDDQPDLPADPQADQPSDFSDDLQPAGSDVSDNELQTDTELSDAAEMDPIWDISGGSAVLSEHHLSFTDCDAAPGSSA